MHSSPTRAQTATSTSSSSTTARYAGGSKDASAVNVRLTPSSMAKSYQASSSSSSKPPQQPQPQLRQQQQRSPKLMSAQPTGQLQQHGDTTHSAAPSKEQTLGLSSSSKEQQPQQQLPTYTSDRKDEMATQSKWPPQYSTDDQSRNDNTSARQHCMNIDQEHVGQQLQQNSTSVTDTRDTISTNAPTQRKSAVRMKLTPRRSERVTLHIEQHNIGNSSNSSQSSEFDPVIIDTIEDEEEEATKKQTCEKSGSADSGRANGEAINNNNTIIASVAGREKIIDVNRSNNTDNDWFKTSANKTITTNSEANRSIGGFSPSKNTPKSTSANDGTKNIVLRARDFDISTRLIETTNARQSSAGSQDNKQPTDTRGLSQSSSPSLSLDHSKQQQQPKTPMLQAHHKAPIPGSAAAAVVQKHTTITADSAALEKETIIATAAAVDSFTASSSSPSSTGSSANSQLAANSSTRSRIGKQMPQSSNISNVDAICKDGPNKVINKQDSPRSSRLSQSTVETITATKPNLTSSPMQQNKSKQLVSNNSNNNYSTSAGEAPKQRSAPANQQQIPSKIPDYSGRKAVSEMGAAVPSFNWDIYLRLNPSEVAPDEAFMQSVEPLPNDFTIDMRLEARDPRNDSSWCLARVVAVYGPRIKLRLDGVDGSNDFWELVNSGNIRPVGAGGNDPLLPPIGYTSNLSTYPKFVEKQLAKRLIAPPQLFLPQPKRPERNMFVEGMKLEAVDRKNPYMICPATVANVHGDEIKIAFDGWSGSFDYRCKYYSRDIFPVNWCEKNGHLISPIKDWAELITNSNDQSKSAATAAGKTSAATMSKFNSQANMPMPASAKLRFKKQTLKVHEKTATSTSLSSEKSKMHNQTQASQNIKSSNVSFGFRKEKNKSAGLANSKSVGDDININPTRRSLDKELARSEKQTPQDSIDDDEELPAGVNKFQCRRAMSYNDWLQEKNNFLKPNRIVEDGEATPNSSMSTPPNLSSPVNQTGNDASTGSQQSTTDDEGHVTKKPKLKLEISPKNFSKWTVANVLDLIKHDETLAKYSEVFENHEIDGKAFLLLTTDVMIKHMGLKIGPVLKINDLIEKVRRLNR